MGTTCCYSQSSAASIISEDAPRRQVSGAGTEAQQGGGPRQDLVFGTTNSSVTCSILVPSFSKQPEVQMQMDYGAGLYGESKWCLAPRIVSEWERRESMRQFRAMDRGHAKWTRMKRSNWFGWSRLCRRRSSKQERLKEAENADVKRLICFCKSAGAVEWF